MATPESWIGNPFANLTIPTVDALNVSHNDPQGLWSANVSSGPVGPNGFAISNVEFIYWSMAYLANIFGLLCQEYPAFKPVPLTPMAEVGEVTLTGAPYQVGLV